MSEYSLLSLPTDMFATLATFLTAADLASLLWCNNRSLNRLLLQRGVIKSISLKATDFQIRKQPTTTSLFPNVPTIPAPDSLLERSKLIYLIRSLTSLNAFSIDWNMSDGFNDVPISVSTILTWLPSDLEKLTIIDGTNWRCMEINRHPIPPFWKRVSPRPIQQFGMGFNNRGQSMMLPTSEIVSLPQTRNVCYRLLQSDYMNNQTFTGLLNINAANIFVFDISQKFPKLQQYLTFFKPDSSFRFLSSSNNNRLCDFGEFAKTFPKTLQTLEIPRERNVWVPFDLKDKLPSSLTCLRLQQAEINLNMSSISDIINSLPHLVEVGVFVKHLQNGTEDLSITSPSIKTVRLELNLLSSQIEFKLSPSVTSLTLHGVTVIEPDVIFAKIVKQLPKLTTLELSGVWELTEESFDMFPQSLTHLSILIPNFCRGKVTPTPFGQPAPPAIFGQPAAPTQGFGQPTPTFSFGQPTPSFSFGQPAASSSSTSFGQPASSSSSSFSFGQPAASSSSFSFGQPTPSSSSSAAEPASSSSSEGQITVSSLGDQSTSAGEPTAPSSSMREQLVSSSSSSSSSEGEPAASSSSKDQAASVGSSLAGQPATSSSSMASQPASTASSKFSFVPATSPEQPAPSFSFASQPASSSSTTFSFGQPTPSFSFGQPSQFSFGQPSQFSFGNPISTDYGSAAPHFQRLPKTLKYYHSISPHVRDEDLALLPSGLKTLILENAQLTNECIAHLPSNLTQLYLSQSRLTEDVIDHIPPSITSLVIEGENWTDYGLWRLWKKQPIHFQILSGARITGQLLPPDIEHLTWKDMIELTKSALPSVLQKQLYSNSNPPATFGNADLIYQHKNRMLSFRNPSRPLSTSIIRLPRSLKTLELIPYFAEIEAIADLQSFNALTLPLPPSLTRIKLQTLAGIPSTIFENLPATLEHLSLSPAYLNGSAVKLLPKNLKTLVIRNTATGFGFGSTALENIKTNLSPEDVGNLPKSLRIFALEDAIPNECIAHLPAELEVLSLSKAQLSEEDFSLLPKSLIKLYLASSLLTEKASQKLQHLQLQHLCVSKMSPEAVPNLPKTLKLLWIGSRCDEIWSNLPPCLTSIVVPTIYLTPKILAPSYNPTVLSLDGCKAALKAMLPADFQFWSNMRMPFATQQFPSNAVVPLGVDELYEPEIVQTFPKYLESDQSKSVDLFNNVPVLLELNTENLQDIPSSVTEIDLPLQERVLIGTPIALTAEQAATLEAESRNLSNNPNGGFSFGSFSAASSTKTSFELLSSLSLEEQLAVIFPRINFSNLPSSITKLKLPCGLHPEDFGTFPPTLTHLNIMADCLGFWNKIPKTVKKFGTSAPNIPFDVGVYLSHLPSHLEEFTLFDHTFLDDQVSISAILPPSLKCLRLPGASLKDSTISHFTNTLQLLQIRQLTLTQHTLKDVKNPNFSHPKIRRIGQDKPGLTQVDQVDQAQDLEYSRTQANIPDNFPIIEAESVTVSSPTFFQSFSRPHPFW